MKFFVDTADVKDIRELNDLGPARRRHHQSVADPEIGRQDRRGHQADLRHRQGSGFGRSHRHRIFRDDARGQGPGQDRRQHLHQGAADARRPQGLQGDPLRDGRLVNVTLCFSANQALLAAKAGATFISPFIGRIDDIGIDGMELIAEIRHDLRQLRLPDRDPRCFGPHREPRQAGGADRRRRRHRAAGDAEGAGQASADRQGPGAVPRRLGKDRPEDRLRWRSAEANALVGEKDRATGLFHCASKIARGPADQSVPSSSGALTCWRRPMMISRLPTWLAAPTKPSFSMRSTRDAARL